jgi:hypothetical protein
MTAFVYLMRMLQPASPAVFITERQQGRGWAQSLANLAKLCDCVELKADHGAEQQHLENGEAVAVRALLEQVLPVAQHVTALLLGSGGTTSASSCPAGTDAPPAPTAATGAPFGTTNSASAAPSACEASGECLEDGSTALDVCPIPVDSTMILLQAASRVVLLCLNLAKDGGSAYQILSRGAQRTRSSSSEPSEPEHYASTDAGGAAQPDMNASASSGPDDLVSALDAVLFLARALVSDGPLWEEAKTKYPLLLIEV